MLVGFIFWGIYKGALLSLAFDRDNLYDLTFIRLLILYSLHDRARNINQIEEIDFYLCSDLAIW